MLAPLIQAFGKEYDGLRTNVQTTPERPRCQNQPVTLRPGIYTTRPTQQISLRNEIRCVGLVEYIPARNVTGPLDLAHPKRLKVLRHLTQP